MDSVTICNYALLMLGIPAITSLDDPNNNARLCRSFYPQLRDRVLRDHTWSFATAYCTLQRIEADGIPGYQFAYSLPADVLRVIRLADDSEYRRIGDTLYANSGSPVLEYVRQVADPNEFDPVFVEALQYLLAAEIGMASTRDAGLISMYRQEYNQRLAVARSIDSQENIHACQPVRPRRSSWIQARYRGV